MKFAASLIAFLASTALAQYISDEPSGSNCDGTNLPLFPSTLSPHSLPFFFATTITNTSQGLNTPNTTSTTQPQQPSPTTTGAMPQGDIPTNTTTTKDLSSFASLHTWNFRLREMGFIQGEVLGLIGLWLAVWVRMGGVRSIVLCLRIGGRVGMIFRSVRMIRGRGGF